MQKYRIEGLSDLVFGLALSIGSLAMINQAINSYSDVLEGIFGFVFGFLVIVSVWVSYTKIISEIKVETAMDFRLNLALLMLVAIEPYLLYLLGHDIATVLDFGSIAYAIDIALIMLILAALYNRKPGPGVPEETVRGTRMERDHFIGIAAVFLISALPFFWVEDALFGINLRFIIWMFATVPGTIIWAIRRRFRTSL